MNFCGKGKKVTLLVAGSEPGKLELSRGRDLRKRTRLAFCRLGRDHRGEELFTQ